MRANLAETVLEGAKIVIYFSPDPIDIVPLALPAPPLLQFSQMETCSFSLQATGVVTCT